MIVTATPARPITIDMFGDITPHVVTSMQWFAGELEVTFAGDLTAAEVEAVVRRIVSRNLNEETLQQQAIQALQNNRDFLALPQPPTNAQVLAQIRALSRQNNGIIRQLLGFLDGTD